MTQTSNGYSCLLPAMALTSKNGPPVICSSSTTHQGRGFFPVQGLSSSVTFKIANSAGEISTSKGTIVTFSPTLGFALSLTSMLTSFQGGRSPSSPLLSELLETVC